MCFKVTDFPVPDGPTMANISPLVTVKLTPASTCLPSNFLNTLSKRIMASEIKVEQPGYHVPKHENEKERYDYATLSGAPHTNCAELRLKTLMA